MNELNPLEQSHETSTGSTSRSIIVLTAVIAAVVGTVFGTYGPALLQSGTSTPNQPIVRDDRQESDLVVSLVQKVSPAVVSIVATKDLTIIEQNPNRFPFCDDPFFRQFFSQCNNPQPQQRTTQRQQIGAGSGFLIQSDGLILTNKHVVNLAGADFTVITNDGKKYPASVVAQDPVQDIALIKINGRNFPTIPVGDSDAVKAGQTVLAIGNALGEFSNSVSKGIISGVSRSIIAQSGGSSERLEQVIQTDAAINPGNSGGPLLNLNGEVIGINTAVASGAQNVGFAIPINQAKRDIKDVEQLGKIVYPYLGVRYVAIDAELKAQRNLPVDYGVLITGTPNGEPGVIPDSPAAAAGVQENDIIIEADGQRITADHSLARVIQNHKVGDTIRLVVLRDNQRKEISVTLRERP